MTMNRIDSFSGTYRWLSNFYPALVKLGDEVYATVEHAYQAAKIAVTDQISRRIREVIQGLPTPGRAKRMGGAVTLRQDWLDIKLEVMSNLLKQKLEHPSLCALLLLLSTGSAELVEGNTWGDTYWGVCNGEGDNHLGRILMRIRSSLS